MTTNIEGYRKPVPVTRAQCKELRVCFNCYQSIRHLRRSARFCNVACKQANYRLMCKVKAEVSAFEAKTKNVTVPAAIGGKTVTDYASSWPSGRQTPAGMTVPPGNT